jgi:hypothetical protein
LRRSTVTEYLKVEASPRYDTYLGRKELKMILDSAGLSQLLPTEKGNKRAWFREMKRLEKELGVSFNLIKESTRDIQWQVTTGPRGRDIGNVWVTYGVQDNKTKNPTWTGAKARFTNKARLTVDKDIFDVVRDRLSEQIASPEHNCYTVHLRFLDFFRSIADMVEARGTGVPNSPASFTFYISPKYQGILSTINNIYDKFDAKLTIERVDL